MMVIPVYPNTVPIEILRTAVQTASKRADWVKVILGLLSVSPAERLKELGPEVRFFLQSYCLFLSFLRISKLCLILCHNVQTPAATYRVKTRHLWLQCISYNE